MIEIDKQFQIDYVDPSGICTFSRCPTLYLFERLMGLKLPDDNTMPVDYGTDMHAALPLCYEEDFSCIEKGAAEFRSRWESRKHGFGDKRRNCTRARESLAEFQRTHKPSVCQYEFVQALQNITAPTADRISPNEVPFLVDVGAELPLAGRIDAVVRMKSDNSLWALDYKTASEISARYFANFENCPQAVGYTKALMLIMSEKVDGLIIDAVRVSPSNDECQLHPVFINQHQIKIFDEMVKRIADDILMCNNEKTWPQHFTGCAPYPMFGQPGRVCEYSDICNVGDWREMVEYYERKPPFHPFKIEK